MLRSQLSNTDMPLTPDAKVLGMYPYPRSILARHPYGFNLEDGWILDEHDLPLVWVPPSYRDGLSGPGCRILSTNMSVLDLSVLVSP